MRKITRVILHCTDSPYPKQTVDDVRAWHLERGWRDIGYHYLICMDGLLQTGRPEEEIGAGVQGFNKESIHVALAGRDIFRKEQFATLESFLKTLAKKFPKATLHGHREFNKNKTCPNFNYAKFVQLWDLERSKVFPGGWVFALN